ncbi:hypothetical protein D3C80_1427140 [compost metagenome]
MKRIAASVPPGLPLSTPQLLQPSSALSKVHLMRSSLSSVMTWARVFQIAPMDTSPSSSSCWVSAPEPQKASTCGLSSSILASARGTSSG